MSVSDITPKTRLLAGEPFEGRRNNHSIFRYNEQEKSIEKWGHSSGIWDYYCLTNKITEKGFTGTISFLGITLVTKIFEFKDMHFVEAQPEKPAQL